MANKWNRQATPKTPVSDASGKHWVTINGAHVLVEGANDDVKKYFNKTHAGISFSDEETYKAYLASGRKISPELAGKVLHQTRGMSAAQYKRLGKIAGNRGLGFH